MTRNEWKRLADDKRGTVTLGEVNLVSIVKESVRTCEEK